MQHRGDAGSFEDRSEFDRLVEQDAYDVACRTLAHDFRHLGNNRILGILRPLASERPDLSTLSNRDLLDRWFASYEVAVDRLRSGGAAGAR